MKKILLGIAFAAFAATASAAPINVSLAFGGALQASPNTIALANLQTQVLFPSTTFFNIPALCTLATFCNGASVTTGDGVFTSGDSQVFTFNPGMTYTVTSAWSVGAVGDGTFRIFTTGNYNDGTGNTPGVLNFSTQVPVIVQGNTLSYSFSASGTTVPEPGSMALLGSGLVGLGMIARRRRK